MSVDGVSVKVPRAIQFAARTIHIEVLLDEHQIVDQDLVDVTWR